MAIVARHSTSGDLPHIKDLCEVRGDPPGR